jgi:hypothetical protein
MIPSCSGFAMTKARRQMPSHEVHIERYARTGPVS